MSDSKPLHSMRLDKWLWCARFFKTRAQAAAALKGNRIKVAEDIVKPSRTVVVGDSILIRKPPFEYQIRIKKLSPNRLSGSLAAELYEESASSISKREQLAAQLKAEAAAFPRTRGRPTKRDRRHIIRFTRSSDEIEND